jgi:hypothetical protein
LRDTSTDPKVHQFFNRVMSKEVAWVNRIQITFAWDYSYLPALLPFLRW